jgi:hypothetical protein
MYRGDFIAYYGLMTRVSNGGCGQLGGAPAAYTHVNEPQLYEPEILTGKNAGTPNERELLTQK